MYVSGHIFVGSVQSVSGCEQMTLNLVKKEQNDGAARQLVNSGCSRCQYEYVRLNVGKEVCEILSARGNAR